MKPLLAGLCASIVLMSAGPTAVDAETYVYDAAGRLVSVSYPTGKKLAYTYDANGNLLRRVVENGTAGDGIAASSLSEAWVDFSYPGTELGTQLNPFDTLAEGAAAVQAGGTVRIKAGTTPAAITFLKPMTLHSSGGPAVIGG